MKHFVLALLLVGYIGFDAIGHEGHNAPAKPFDKVIDNPNLPRVLLLGDSISIGYTVPVRNKLAGRANVHRAPENCGPTTRGLERLSEWLGDRRWDVIHFNFGLHDLKYMDEKGKLVAPAEGKIQVVLDDYKKNLQEIVRRLKQTRATLIWCATTPVPEGANGRIAGDENEYNRIAAEVIQEASSDTKILVNNLHQFANQRLSEIQQPANVHFTREGSKLLATAVVESIEQALNIQSSKPSIAEGHVFFDSNGNGKFDSAERGIPNIKVSNGRDIVKTSESGAYEIEVSNDSILFVIKPRGWQSPLSDEKLPRFYYIHKPAGSPAFQFEGVKPTGALPNQIDFALYPQKEPETFKAILFGDPQPSDQKEVDYIAHDVVEELVGTDALFGVTLGDIVNNDLSLFESQAKAIAVLGIPWHNVIGNHDMNFDAKNDKLSDETFERMFGPSYYSFDYGPVHFLVLDDVEWRVEENGKSGYRGGLGKEQMEFIRNDLSRIPHDQLVVLLMHIPLIDVHDRHELYRLIEKRPFCMSVSAHRHIHEHRFITREDGWRGPQPHHHVINVTVSGSWWQGKQDERGIPHATMADGAPNGYSIISFDGQKYDIQFKAAGRSKDYQMNIHAPEMVPHDKTGETEFYVNVFNGSPRTKVQFRVASNQPWARMEHASMVDPAFQHTFDTELAIRSNLEKQESSKKLLWKKLTSPKVSSHIWKAKLPSDLSKGTHAIEVRATDANDKVYEDRRIIRIE